MKVKRSISFTDRSINLLNKIQNKLDDMNTSIIFEAAINKFYAIGKVDTPETENDSDEKRITIYLDEATNAKLNELAFIYKMSYKDISNLIIEKIYG